MAQDSSPLAPEEIIALEGAITGKQLLAAKAAISDGETRPVNFCVAITGNVQKGFGTPSSVTLHPARVSLTSLPVFCALLRELGYGPTRVKRALEALPPVAGIPVDGELAKVFDDVAASIAKRLPEQPVTTNGRAGAVTSSVTAQRC